MKRPSKIISRSYRITQKELKKRLGLVGDIQEIGLFQGINLFQENEGKSHEQDEWEIVTHQVEEIDE